MKKYNAFIVLTVIMALVFTGCSGNAIEGSNAELVQEDSHEASSDASETKAVQGITLSENATIIELSDDEITVDGQIISTDADSAVYAGAEIVYYEEGHDETYGEGSSEDAHTAEEAGQHTVITITQPGTYSVSGKLSYGQIAVDLGEDAEDDESAVVNLVLNNADITCTLAPAIVVYNAYECGDDKEENATAIVDTQAAGFNIILAKDSKNVVSGDHVAKIYKDGTTKEDIANDEAKKKYKFDATIDSLVSFNIYGEENGTLTVNAQNEGISSSLHLTINGGNINIISSDDAINTNEDNVSVLTINGGTLICDSGLGQEGDGIDSNGYIVMNGGYVITGANPNSQDSGIDSDKGIYINGGTLLATGNMYDEISSDSTQKFAVFNFSQPISEDELVLLADEKDNSIAAFYGVNKFTIAVYSSSELTESEYHLYKVSSVTGDLNGSIYTNITDYQDAQELQYSSDAMMGGRGGMGNKMDAPEGNFEKGERPEWQESEEPPQMPDGEQPPEMPNGEQPPEIPNGELPEKPEAQ